jgi:thiol-disulfide isomerase/thioredoxin
MRQAYQSQLRGFNREAVGEPNLWHAVSMRKAVPLPLLYFVSLAMLLGCHPKDVTPAAAVEDNSTALVKRSADSTAQPPVKPILASDASSPNATQAIPPTKRPTMVPVAPGDKDVTDVMRRELRRAEADGYGVIVYVGATWCEPCERFKDALAARRLDEAFSGIRFIEFDHDHHAEPLKAAGYGGRLVPLFAVPKPDGTASEVRHEGAIRGAGAVSFLLPRLKPLVDAALKR